MEVDQAPSVPAVNADNKNATEEKPSTLGSPAKPAGRGLRQGVRGRHSWLSYAAGNPYSELSVDACALSNDLSVQLAPRIALHTC